MSVNDSFPTASKVQGFNEQGEPVQCWPVDARERMASVPPTFFVTWPPPETPAAVSASAAPVAVAITPKR